MTDESGVSLGDVIFSGIDRNPYLNELYESILFNYALRLFKSKRERKPVSISDALQFADILSKSPSDSHMTWAQEIVALLKETESDNPTIDLYLKSVLSNTGNYQGLEPAAIFPTYFVKFSCHKQIMPAKIYFVWRKNRSLLRYFRL